MGYAGFVPSTVGLALVRPFCWGHAGWPRPERYRVLGSSVPLFPGPSGKLENWSEAGSANELWWTGFYKLLVFRVFGVWGVRCLGCGVLGV